MAGSVGIRELSRALPRKVGSQKIEFDREDYALRLQRLRERMSAAGLSHVLVFADREHFANMEYLIGYDPRFEEALLLVSLEERLTLFVGNEGLGYAAALTLTIDLVLYQHFSLQGQPRQRLQPLADLLLQAGLTARSTLGVIGYKYFLETELPGAEHRYDLPSYVLEEITAVVPAERMINATAILTGMPDGLRLCLQSAREIAHYEYIASRCSEKIRRMLYAIKPGISEIELSEAAGLDGLPQQVHAMINFDEEHVSSGLRSPNDRRLRLGEVAGICLGPRGALVSRVGVACYDEASLSTELAGSIAAFYQRHWRVVVSWYEQLQLGVSCGSIYADLEPELQALGVSLNPGHYIAADEWVNAPFAKGSSVTLQSGNYLQSDIIASSVNPCRVSIMEDGAVLADLAMRTELSEQYPECMARIVERRAFMDEVLGIRLDEAVLPLSNLCGAYFPYLLDPTKVFTLVR